MKLKFKNQDFQTTAVNAVCNLFLGQEKKQATFLANMQEIQRQNSLPLTADIRGEGKLGTAANSFYIEMETGTGKTYAYTKSIFELHKRCGFTEFIIVVPSVAIREGVYTGQGRQRKAVLCHGNKGCGRYMEFEHHKAAENPLWRATL